MHISTVTDKHRQKKEQKRNRTVYTLAGNIVHRSYGQSSGNVGVRQAFDPSRSVRSSA